MLDVNRTLVYSGTLMQASRRTSSAHQKRLKQIGTGLVHLAWRQKYVIVATILFLFGLYVIVSKTSVTEPLPSYEDDFFIATIGQQVEKSNYNNKSISMFDPGLLEEMRKKWIVNRYNASLPYNLDNPEVIDPSMGQAAKINEVFKNMTNGFFIECGAYDGQTRSNTLFFERYLNWTGILIEADPINYRKLQQKNRKAYLSNTCLSTKKYPMLGTFLMADNIGRLHKEHGTDEEGLENTPDVAHHGEHIKIQCLPLASYVAALDFKRVDYFSLDIEGQELEVLETIPFDKIDIKTLSVEYIHGDNSLELMSSMMAKRGYDVIGLVTHENNLANDLIFAKKGFKESLH
ncbi:uncharacterized protein LOC124177538 isoform X1 [Neodiprion fabricii]|uniref:uncharacterized protein LOC124177538 isoform X1 n=1 Tax=Neodiprion fabricii TaxID=2872261 RepID=UPI001ED9054D|nr:uncharacterized protein LOC124177538 isoform X1 [Neodiprion fabricii]